MPDSKQPDKHQSYSHIDVTPFAPNLGAEIRGIQIADGVNDEQFAEIHHAFLAHQVLFFKDQKEITPEAHIDFGKRFGPLACASSRPDHDRLSRNF